MVDTEKGVKIANRLRADFDIVESLGYTCIGTFLFGSQNYEIDTDESDIDTRAIVIPNFMDVVKSMSYEGQFVEEKIKLDNSEQKTNMDIIYFIIIF